MNRDNKHRRKDRMLKYRYGIRLSDFEKILSKQNRCCAVCGEDFITVPEVDHSHKSGEVRGLLCHYCNIFVGYLEKTPDLISPAIDYIKKDG